MSKLKDRIEIAANIAIICVAVLLFAAIIRNYVWRGDPNSGKSGPTEQATPTLTGSSLAVNGVDWKKNKQTLVLLLSPSCRFCTEGADLYKLLVQESASNKNFHLAAALSSPVKESRAYLASLGVNIDDVFQWDMRSIKGFRGTPTIILVDNQGEIVDSWVGKLTNEQQDRLFNRLR